MRFGRAAEVAFGRGSSGATAVTSSSRGHRRPTRSGVGQLGVGAEDGDRVRARRTEERMAASVHFDVAED
jgi:hypothetical protein